MKFNFRKIASAAASTVLIGSTVALAAAASYPAPFVQNGNADVAIVYGSGAASSDLVAATDIATNLNSAFVSQGGGSASTPTGGDFVKLERASTKFQLGNGIIDVVSATVTDSDLPELLADGVYLDSGNNEKDYTQKLTLANLSYSMFDDNDYKEDSPTIGMSISSGTNVLNYTLDFTDSPNWNNLTATDINIMGKDYYILSVTENTTINLLDSAVTAVLNEGETKTLTSGGKSYQTSISFIGSSSVKLVVNGETTNSLGSGETYKLTDGTYVGIKSIDTQDYQGGIKQVEFSLGSGKLELTNASDVKLNEDTINDLTASFTVSSSSGSTQLDDINLQWDADDDLFVAEDSAAAIPGFKNIELSYTGLTAPADEAISVDPNGDYVKLSNFPLTTSDEDIALLYATTSGSFVGIGKDATSQLRTSNSSSITFDGDTDDYFVASYDDGTNVESYLMKTTSFKTESNVNKTTFQYKKDGTWTTTEEDAEPTDEINLGSVILTVGAIDKNGKSVVITAGTNVYFNRLYSAEGLRLWLPWEAVGNATNGGTNLGPGAINFTSSTSLHNATSWSLVMHEEDKNENIASGNQFNATLGWTSGTPETYVADVVGESATFSEIGDTDVFRSFIYSALATELLWDKKTSGVYSLDVMYHGGESYGNFYITQKGATTGSSGEIGSITVLDSEVASVSSKNMIVVGGSCVNTVAASLLGSDSPMCGAAFESATGVGAGEYLIQSFASPFSGSKVAVLVAGYNAADTTNAAKYLTTQTPDTASGMKYVGTTADSAQLV